MAVSLFDTNSSSLPPWVEPAIALLEPLLRVMARPVVVNNLRRAAADPARPTDEELLLFLERVERSIGTFASPQRARTTMPSLRRLLFLERESRIPRSAHIRSLPDAAVREKEESLVLAASPLA